LKVALYKPGNPSTPLAVKNINRRENCVEWVYEQVGYQPAKSETIMTEMFPGMATDLRKFVQGAVVSGSKGKSGK
jgi:hypothetical protein